MPFFSLLLRFVLDRLFVNREREKAHVSACSTIKKQLDPIEQWKTDDRIEASLYLDELFNRNISNE